MKINNAVEFSDAMLSLIEGVLQNSDFNHKDWDSEHLMELRRHIREHYRSEQRLRCMYCANPIGQRSAAAAPIEHIVPKSLYPKFMFEPRNLCVICADCNEIKRSKDPTRLEDPLVRKSPGYPGRSDAFHIVHPHFDVYEEHIHRANKIYIPLTRKGNWTIYVCELNRFFMRFGVCGELIDDLELIAREERFFA